MDVGSQFSVKDIWKFPLTVYENPDRFFRDGRNKKQNEQNGKLYGITN